MEEKQIIYTGITQSGSDLNSNDGDLSICHNLSNQNGVIKPICISPASFTLGVGERLLYVHVTSSYKNYLYYYDGSIKAFYINDEGVRVNYDKFSIECSTDDINISSVGNTLIITSSGEAIQYILYSDNKYESLGSKPPEIELGFFLSGSYKVEYKEVKSDSNSGGSLYDENNQVKIANQVSAVVNKLIAEETEKNRFTGSFFVRYGYRIAGKLSMLSSPIFIENNFGGNSVFYVYGDNYGALSSFTGMAHLFSGALCYYQESNYSELKKWSDLISDIEIYVSPQIHSYDQNGKAIDVNTLYKSRTNAHYDNGGSTPIVNNGDNLVAICSNSGETSYKYAVTGMHKDEKELLKELTESSSFYRLATIGISNFYNSTLKWNKVNVEENKLKNILLSVSLSDETDDYNQHDILYADNSFVYNGRVNLYGVSAKKYPFGVRVLSQYTNAVTDATGNISTASKSSYDYVAYFRVKYGSESYWIKSESYTQLLKTPYIYYPDNNVREAIIERTNSGGVREYALLAMNEHPFLQGSYWCASVSSVFYGSDFTWVDISINDYIGNNDVNRTIPYLNKIYTSELNNPFVFPLGGINSVGVGNIAGVSSTTKALSQGQFGQFPLLVFSTDGIWAMEVNSQGLYSSKQPISRDVCSNPKSITPIDGAVIFVSKKGLMVIEGSNVSLLSSNLDGSSFSIDSVVKLSDILANEGFNEIKNILRVSDFFSLCSIAYDYPNLRIILFRSDCGYAYVYSLSNGTWATMKSSIVRSVSDYPDTYIQLKDGKVVKLSDKIDYDSTSTTKGIMLSRPIKLGDDYFKSVSSVINRGALYRKSGAIVLFGSSDGISYVPIGSAIGHEISRLQGSPYRYFRIAIVCNMKMDESISSTSIYYKEKWRNKGR